MSTATATATAAVPDTGDATASATWPALGTTVRVVVAEPAALAAAVVAVGALIDDVDRTCSRFRGDSELMRLRSAAGHRTAVSPLLARALDAALRAARLTDGAVDPTGGASIRALGYDRDFAAIDPDEARSPATTIAFPGWKLIDLDREAGTVCIPRNVDLDLGATAKGLAADLAAAAAARAADGTGVLVSLGGDIAVAGATPPEGWPVLVADDHRAAADTVGPRIVLRDGGLATSSTTVRRWQHAEGTAHHVLDPETGAPAASPWRTVTVAAGSCLDANIASTASIVMGYDAPDWLEALRLPARLVTTDGTVVTVGAWPHDDLTQEWAP